MFAVLTPVPVQLWGIFLTALVVNTRVNTLMWASLHRITDACQ